jgi:hypothetical protein
MLKRLHSPARDSSRFSIDRTPFSVSNRAAVRVSKGHDSQYVVGNGNDFFSAAHINTCGAPHPHLRGVPRIIPYEGLRTAPPRSIKPRSFMVKRLV